MIPHPSPFGRRSIAAAAVAVLLVSGLSAIGQAPSAAAAPGDAPESLLVSRADAGSSTEPVITTDGQHVVFTSTEALVPGDTNGVRDIYLATAIPGSDDPFSGAPVLVSRPDRSAAIANGGSSDAEPSADGRYIVFTSEATNLAGPATTPGRSHVYVRDTALGTTTRLEAGAVEPDGRSWDADISATGRWIVFTSLATDFIAGDVDGAADVIVADRDPDGDGSFGQPAFSSPTGSEFTATAYGGARVSGNGAYLLYRSTTDDPIPGRPAGGFLYRVQTSDFSGGQFLERYSTGADIDATGSSIVTTVNGVCTGSGALIVAMTWDGPNRLAVAVGERSMELRSGKNMNPRISADGSTVAWESTMVPRTFQDELPPALVEPVIRVQKPSWSDAWRSSQQPGPATVCQPSGGENYTEIGPGTSPSLSASGRSLAYSGRSAVAPDAEASVIALDRHTNDGVSVSTVQGSVSASSFLTAFNTANITASAVRNYTAAIADAPIHRVPIHRVPIHRVPIHRVPIHRVPIHRVPIHRVPIHRVDLPGGWADALKDTPFADQSELTVVLGDVLDWADAHIGDPAGSPTQLAAARIQSLTLDDIDLDGSGIDALSLASIVLASAPLSEVAIAGPGSNTARWQALVNAQGIDASVDASSALAELDWAGLDIALTGVDLVRAGSLPIADTALGEFPLTSMFFVGTTIGETNVSALSDAGALFTQPVTGTIAANLAFLRPQATAADLARVAPATTTFGDVLTTLLDRASYPWEQISPTALEARRAETISNWYCVTASCAHESVFRFTFDAGPGESPVFPSAIATLTTPKGSRPDNLNVTGAGPGTSLAKTLVDASAYAVDLEQLTVPMGDVAAGTTLQYVAPYSITSLPGDGTVVGTLTSGGRTASASLPYSLPYDYFDSNVNDILPSGQWGGGNAPAPLQQGNVYYGWLSASRTLVGSEWITGPSSDVDYYTVTAPPAGKRLLVSTNAGDGQLSISLFKPTDDTTDLGVADLGPAPGAATVEQPAGTSGAPSRAGSDVAATLVGNVLMDQATVAGDGAAELEAASIDATPGETLIVRVASGNGTGTSSLYSLRVQYLDEPAEQVCAAWAPTQTADPGVVGTSDEITDATNTVYLVDTRRFGDTWGAAGAAQVRTALAGIDGMGAGAPVHGAVLSIDASPAVQAARAALDANPCSVAARSALTKAINQYVSAELGGRRAQITSIAIIGGDDIVPLAPIAEQTAQFTEAGHAAELRLTEIPSGGECPSTVADGAVDPCATPLSAAAATRHILSDDPYGLAGAYTTLAGTLYVPSVAVGRVVETPDQIIATLGRFVASDGVLTADSTLTAGYGAWSELPDLVTANLAWRSDANQSLATPWDKTALGAALFPTGAASARVVSINAHYDETRLLPGVDGAAGNVFADGDLYDASSVTDASAIGGSLVFTIGCHAANNLPTSYYGAKPDWVDVFQNAAGFVGNTGYGLANSATTALSERLLSLYSSWIGVTSGGAPVSAAGALTQAKRAYLAGLGLYSGYDQKALMESVYYGLPMYTFADSTRVAPLPGIPAGLTPIGSADGLTSASLTLHPSFQQQQAEGRTYLVADGEAPAIISGEPVLPRVTSRLNPAPEGQKARGALIRGLTSEFGATVSPLIGDATAGVADLDDASRSDIAFPSTFAHVVTQQTPAGPVDLLVVTPARVQARVGGQGTIEKFTDMSIDVVYGDAAIDDEVDPVIQSTEMTSNGATASLKVSADGTGSDIAAMLVLAQPTGSTQWRAFSLTNGPAGWSGAIGIAGEFRWFLQVVDTAGNVAIDTGRGHIDVAGAAKPVLGTAGADVALASGDRLQRAVQVTDATVDDRLTGTFHIDGGSGPIAAGALIVAPDATGSTSALLDAVIVAAPGDYTAYLRVCRADACTQTSFGVEVPVINHLPTATVTLSADSAAVGPDSTLSAEASGVDPDPGDRVTISYRWLRNGLPIDGAEAPTFALRGIAQGGDVITVEATPNDGTADGGAARASVIVIAPAPPPPPTITLTATDGSVPYAAGTWSRKAVTVTFACASAVAVISCTAVQKVSADTGAAGVVVSGTVVDIAGRTASASIVVRVDKTKPSLSPTVTPNPVRQGAAAAAMPNASDAASGVASALCTPPSTATPGQRTVTCTATDVAGNVASATTSYLVTPGACLGGSDRAALVPVNADGSSVFRRLSAVPITFRACDAHGRPIGTSGFVKSVTQIGSVALPAAATVNEVTYLLPRIRPIYVRLTGTWIGAIGSATLTPGLKYTYRVLLADGTSFTFSFGVR